MASYKTSGFTVLELLTVLAIILILVATALIGVDAASRRARDDRRVTHIREVMLALEQYRDVCGQYPKEFKPQITNGCPTVDGIQANFASFLPGRKIPEGPSGHPHVWSYLPLASEGSASDSSRCTGYHVGIAFESSHSSLGADSDVDSKNDAIPNRQKCTSAPGSMTGFLGVSGDCKNAATALEDDRCLDYTK